MKYAIEFDGMSFNTQFVRVDLENNTIEMHFKNNFANSLKWLFDRIEVDLFNHANVMTATLDDVNAGLMHIIVAN